MSREKSVALFPILLSLLLVLVGCADSGSTSPTATLLVPPAPSLEVRPSATPAGPIVLPSPTPTLLSIPAPTLEVQDFRDRLPQPPPGFGEAMGHLVFFSNRTGSYELYRINLDGSDPTQLTTSGAYDMEPAWSPSGDRVAFTSPHVNGHWEVFILDYASGDWEQISDLNADAWSLAWAPDASSLLYVSNATGDDEIYRYFLDSGETVNVTESPASHDFRPDWSPDGTRVAFVSTRDGMESIYVMDADGQNVQALTAPEASEQAPDWSPDGAKIAFVSDRDENFNIYVMDANGENQIALLRTPAYEWSPRWSPDGTLIAFTSTSQDGETYDLYLMNADGTDVRQLTTDPSDDIEPLWWP